MKLKLLAIILIVIAIGLPSQAMARNGQGGNLVSILGRSNDQELENAAFDPSASGSEPNDFELDTNQDVEDHVKLIRHKRQMRGRGRGGRGRGGGMRGGRRG